MVQILLPLYITHFTVETLPPTVFPSHPAPPRPPHLSHISLRPAAAGGPPHPSRRHHNQPHILALLRSTSPSIPVSASLATCTGRSGIPNTHHGGGGVAPLGSAVSTADSAQIRVSTPAVTSRLIPQLTPSRFFYCFWLRLHATAQQPPLLPESLLNSSLSLAVRPQHGRRVVRHLRPRVLVCFMSFLPFSLTKIKK
jgi:hypothetical protein